MEDFTYFNQYFILFGHSKIQVKVLASIEIIPKFHKSRTLYYYKFSSALRSSYLDPENFLQQDVPYT